MVLVTSDLILTKRKGADFYIFYREIDVSELVETETVVSLSKLWLSIGGS